MIRFLVALFAAAALGVAAANAQTGWTLEAAAGGAVHDPLASHVASTTASLGLSYDGGAHWGYAAAGAPLSGEGPSWGSAGLGAWLARPLRGFEAGVLASAEAFGYGGGAQEVSGAGVSARVLPGVALTRGPLRAELYGGVAGQTASQADSTARRGVAEALGQVAWSVENGPVLTAAARYLVAEEGGYPFLGASAELRRPRGSVWAEAGSWFGGGLPGPRAALAAGGELRLDGRTGVGVSWRQEPSEPLFRNPPRRTWNILLRRSLGGAAAGAAAPRQPVARLANGSVTFRLPRREHPAAPSLISDLTGWRPVPLREAGDAWALTLAAAPGVHRYAFRTPQGGTWLPPGEPREDDGFGGYNALLVVP